MSAKRYVALDGIRGFALLNMMIYHAIWDLMYLFGFNWDWYYSRAAYLWQQAICCSFIFLSGFCWSLSRRNLKRGACVFLAGALVSAVTMFVMPENQVLFGVLTLIGSCMLLMVPLKQVIARCRPLPALAVCLALFALTKNINEGYLGFGGWAALELPESWYRNLATTYLGFPAQGFYSTDYFSLFPWAFLFAAGFFSYQLLNERQLLSHLEPGRVKPVEWIGRHSLGIYMAHQPVLYFVFSAFLCVGEKCF